MTHELYTVTRFERVEPFVLRVYFDDGANRVIDFRPVLWGEIFEPLRDPEVFDRVRLDPEFGTLVWPSGADFDPETLHNWSRYVENLATPLLDHVAEGES